VGALRVSARRQCCSERSRQKNGLLHVELVRELPEAMKPRTIPIATKGVETKSEKPKVVDSKAA
jgi:hypothetical protein